MNSVESKLKTNNLWKNNLDLLVPVRAWWMAEQLAVTVGIPLRCGLPFCCELMYGRRPQLFNEIFSFLLARSENDDSSTTKKSGGGERNQSGLRVLQVLSMFFYWKRI
ncbi:OLC1v1026955C1 [Oldenlandia corymbosa var. corymbosa]|uniref:OLC1v1026955C1 n=1 Tax=Oldenlandia corymbosa var. corymbosa TaxID=529605 RepID=A0AAV1CB31_OLDCO|nr:OLC1v1026955C1 [Oldenlandia corymbosa var. corymbosa]